jgi:hypothetical protein
MSMPSQAPPARGPALETDASTPRRYIDDSGRLRPLDVARDLIWADSAPWTACERAVLAVLAVTVDNDTHETWAGTASQGRLARRTGWSDGAVKVALDALELSGAFTVIRGKKPGSKEAAVNRYRLDVVVLAACVGQPRPAAWDREKVRKGRAGQGKGKHGGAVVTVGYPVPHLANDVDEVPSTPRGSPSTPPPGPPSTPRGSPSTSSLPLSAKSDLPGTVCEAKARAHTSTDGGLFGEEDQKAQHAAAVLAILREHEPIAQALGQDIGDTALALAEEHAAIDKVRVGVGDLARKVKLCAVRKADIRPKLASYIDGARLDSTPANGGAGGSQRVKQPAANRRWKEAGGK